jgi:hypothetical protein
MNTLKIEALLAKKYNYIPLPDELSDKYRNFFKENIPQFLRINGDTKTLFTSEGTKICEGYDRIVIGDYGAFIEFSNKPNDVEFIVQPGQEYRINDKKYSKNVKYIWLTIDDSSGIKYISTEEESKICRLSSKEILCKRSRVFYKGWFIRK